MTPGNTLSTDESKVLPRARVKDLVVQKMENETLVYDLKTDKAHHLNSTMSIVWSKCDGNSPMDELSIALEAELDTKIGADFIELALEELNKSSLLEGVGAKAGGIEVSRRKVLLRYALPAIAAPVVMSLVSPASAQMGSCLAANEPCNGSSECCSNICEGVCF